jgi:hypothetical protein
LAVEYTISRKTIEGIVSAVRKQAVAPPHPPSMELASEQAQGRPV